MDSGKRVAVAALAMMASACVQLLGDDFVVEEGSGANGGNEGGGGDGGKGGGGAEPVGPLSCGFTDVRAIGSLEGEVPPLHLYDGRIRMAFADHRLRVFVGRTLANGPGVEVLTVEVNQVRTTLFPGYDTLQAERMDGTSVGALIGRQEPDADHALDFIRIDDADADASQATTETLVSDLMTIAGLKSRFVSVSGNEIALILTHRPSAGTPFFARFGRVTLGVPTLPGVFDDSSSDSALGAGDYIPTAFVRDAANNNHVIFRELFDGASFARHFVLTDSTSGIVPPASKLPMTTETPLLLGLRRRTGGGYLAGYALLGLSVDLRLGVVEDADLVTHDPQSLSLAGSIQNGELPNEAAFALSDDSVVLLGPSSPSAFRVIIAHRSGTLRTNAEVPLPNPSLIPGGATVERVSALVASPSFDTAIGGSIAVSWYVTVPPDGHGRIYYGNLVCN